MGRCAISHLPEPRLVDAAHIVTDADKELGSRLSRTGLPLTKIHHTAFNAHLIGVDPISESISLSGCSMSSALTERYRLEPS